MAFCIYCGKQLEDGQVCSCEDAQAAAKAQQTTPDSQTQQTQQAAPEPQTQQTQQAASEPQTQQAAPNPQLEQAKKAAAKAQDTVVKAAKDVTPFLKTYFENPKQAIQEVMDKDNLTMAVTLTVIRALAMILAIYGTFRSLCKFVQKTASQGIGGFLGAKISAPFIESFLYGILIAVIGMALFVLLLFIMVKIQKGTLSIRAIYEANACNGVLTSAMLLLTFLFSFISIQAALVFAALSILSWVICGVLTAQIVCPNSSNALFWIIYFVGVAVIFAIGIKLIPILLVKVLGGISVSASGESAKLKEFIGDINLSNIMDALDGLSSIF